MTLYFFYPFLKNGCIGFLEAKPVSKVGGLNNSKVGQGSL